VFRNGKFSDDLMETVADDVFEVGYFLKDMRYVSELTLHQVYWHRERLMRIFKEQHER
jgi:hypothetical protein